MKQNRNVCPSCGYYPLVDNGGTLFCPSCDSSFKIEDDDKDKYSTDFEFIDEIRKSVFEINGIGKEIESFGTGFAIANDLILTCAHVISECENPSGTFRYLEHSIEVSIQGENPSNATVIKVDKSLDLAILKICNKRVLNPLKFDVKKQPNGAKVFAIGNGKGNGISTVDGVISDYYRKVNDRSLMLFSAPVISGYSGGPVVNTKGLVIGVVTGGEVDESTMNYAIPSDVVLEFIKECI